MAFELQNETTTESGLGQPRAAGIVVGALAVTDDIVRVPYAQTFASSRIERVMQEQVRSVGLASARFSSPAMPAIWPTPRPWARSNTASSISAFRS